FELPFQVERSLNSCPWHTFRDFGISDDQFVEIEIFFPRSHGMTLDKTVCIFTRDPSLNQVEQQLPAENKPTRALQIGEHSFRIDKHCLDQVRSLIQQIICERCRVGNDDTLRRRMRNITLMPEGDIF